MQAVFRLNYPFPTFSLQVVFNPQLVIAANFAALKDLRLDGLPITASATRGLCHEIIYQLDNYFSDPLFKLDLPLSFNGTLHQLKVWQLMRQLRAGQVLSYGAVARLIDSAAQAVGGACGRNPLPLLIPCHRIIAADNRIGGFNSGKADLNLAIKKWLLQHEGISIQN